MVIASGENTEVKIRTDHTTPRTILIVNGYSVSTYQFLLEDFFRPEKMKGSAENDPSCWVTPISVLSTTSTGY